MLLINTLQALLIGYLIGTFQKQIYKGISTVVKTYNSLRERYINS